MLNAYIVNAITYCNPDKNRISVFLYCIRIKPIFDIQ